MSRLTKNIFYNFAGMGLLLVLGFVSVKYVFKQLGADALGIIYFAVTLNVVLTSVLDKSISVTTVREISAHFHDKPDYIHKFVRTGALFCWGVYAVLGLVVYLVAPILVEKWINLKTMDTTTAIKTLQILGVASLSAFPRSFYASLLRGLQRMEFNNIIDVSTNGIQQLGTIIILIMSGDIFSIAYWHAACYGISLLVYVAVSSRFFSIKSMFPGCSSTVVKTNRHFTSNMIYISIMAMIHNQAEKVIVSKWLPVDILGVYSVAYSLVSKAGLVTSSISSAAFPSLSELYKAGNRENLLSQYLKLQDFISYMTVPLFAAVQFFSLPLLTYLFNAEIAHTLFMPISFLCFGYYLNGTLNIQYQFSLAAGKPEITVKSNFYALFIMPITAFLIYKFGLNGAGLSWVLFNIFVYAYGVPRVYRECIGMPVGTWYSHMLKVLALTGLTYGSAWIVLIFLGVYSILFLSIAYVTATIMFLVGTYFMISDDLRRSLFDHIKLLSYRLNIKR